MSALHREILTDDQETVLHAGQEALAPIGAVLAGGLALALRYGHRRSHDVDWFLPAATDTVGLAEAPAPRAGG